MKTFLRYLYALLAIPLVIVLRFALMPLIGPGIPYITLFPVTVAVALLAGLGPAILTGILSTIVIDYLFIEPLYSIDFNVAGFSRMAVVVLTSAFVGYVGEVLRAARTKAEKQALALRDSQTDLNRAQTVGNIGSWRLDVRRNELTWSDENHRIFGILKGTPMTYETFLSTIHPDDREYVNARWKAGLAGENYDIEHRIIVDGNIKWVREKAFIEFDKDGTLLGGFGTTQDITERKKNEEALRRAHDELELRVKERTADLNETVAELESQVQQRIAAEEALRSASLYTRGLLEASLDPLVTISPKGKITDVNKATEFATGIPRDELIGSDFSDYFTEPDKAKEGYQKVISEGIVRDYPLTIRHVSGSTTDVLYNATVYKNEAGQVQGVFAAARDITKRKAAEERQRITNVLLELFVTKSSRKDYLDAVVGVIRDWSGFEFVGIRIRNADGNIPYESYVGFDRDFLALENALHMDRDKCVCARMILEKPQDQERNFISAGGSFYCNDSMAFLNGLSQQQKKEYRGNCTKQGFQSIAVVPIRYHGQVYGIIHIADFKKDMAPVQIIQFIETTVSPLIGEAVHRFNAEAELEEYRLNLEDLVKQRTDELMRSNKELEQFAYVASHDLQEPLRIIAGYTQLLQHRYTDKLDEDANQFISFTVDSAVRMQTLINDLLSYSRIETKGKAFEPVDCQAVLDDVVCTLRMMVEESGAVITYDKLPTVHADRTQMFQLFQNLIANAVKFRSSEPPRIHIAAEPKNERWLFSVKDNGIGIDPKYSERIFVIFQRLHTREKYPGTGIGLAICKKIVERHGGQIWVESQPGKGSTFYFTI